MFWRSNNKNKAAWAMRWVSPGIMIGHEGDANGWISYRNAVIRAAGNHVRSPDLYDELSGQTADDGTCFDLTTPGSSREPLAGSAVAPRMLGQESQEPRVSPSVDPVDVRDSSVRPRDELATPPGKRSRRQG